MYYYYFKSQTLELYSPRLSLSPRDIEQIRVDMSNEEKYLQIWKAISPYFILPSWHKDFNAQHYKEITSIISENPLFLEKILIVEKDKTAYEQLLDFIAFSGLLDIPKNPSFISIQLFLENTLKSILSSPDYLKYCELALELQEYFQLDFGASASYLERILESKEALLSGNTNSSDFFLQEDNLVYEALYHETVLEEQKANINEFLQTEGIRDTEMRRWKKKLNPSLQKWIQNHSKDNVDNVDNVDDVDDVDDAEYVLWSEVLPEEKHYLSLIIQEGLFFFQWRGNSPLFDLWLDTQELLLLPIMDSWQKRERQYWELPIRPGSQLKFIWRGNTQLVSLF